MSMLTLDHPKIATPDHDVLDLIKERWSPRAFADRSVSDETLLQLLEAARWAPSSYNEQPWRFIVAKREQTDAFDRLLNCLNEKNQQWARHAPVLMLTIAKQHFSRNNKLNAHAWHDVGLAMGQLAIQATALDLHVHQMAGILSEKARETYKIPDEFEVVAGVAIGYYGEPEGELKPRSRRPLEELVFGDVWGKSTEVLR